ncbi:ParA family protein, partial [Staphylococcus simulans]
YVTAELFYVGNMVKHNTKSSIAFKTAIEQDQKFITYFPDKELITRSVLEKTPIVALQKDSKLYAKEKNFFDQFSESCKAIQDASI